MPSGERAVSLTIQADKGCKDVFLRSNCSENNPDLACILPKA